jgi:tRNA pseudouridine38-40 synthase
MRRIRLRVAYDGTNYCGWQIQNNGVTVEQRLLEALQQLLKEPVEVIGASRTDSGVHALGNVAVFDTDSRIPPEKFAIALNHYLPEDIRIVMSEEVDPKFHPRYCESVKTYEYSVLLSAIAIPQKLRCSHHVYQTLDLEKMRMLAKLFVGTHDFSAFCSAGSQVRTKTRTVYRVEIEENPLYTEAGENIPGLENSRELRIRISGNGFLYNMVRIIAGTLLEVGMGRRTVETVRQALETGKRELAGATAPAKGLTLIKIDYTQP